MHPSWSPTGDRLVFESNRYGNDDLFVVDLASGSITRLTDASANDARPVWSPDGEWIAFHSNRSGNYDIYRIRPDGTDLRRATDSDLDETSPAWNPAATTLAYEIRRDHHWYLGRVSLVDGSTSVLVDGQGDHLTPAWLSNDELVFTYAPPGGNHDTAIILETLDLDGRLGRELLGGLRGNSNANYSARRGELVFNSIRDGNWEIYVAGLDGRGSRRLTTQEQPGMAGIDGQPEWSPSGAQIAITSGRAGSLDIVLLDAQGNEIRNLTSSWRQEPADPAKRSGDRSRLVASSPPAAACRQELPPCLACPIHWDGPTNRSTSGRLPCVTTARGLRHHPFHGIDPGGDYDLHGGPRTSRR